ncbi:diguanylate cyclase (GGDEF) domain-containing protein [Duganella sp. CF402]|uniref:EAL domain-containing protein n=1 Tax=unclassified Duganella TaxID=2636909 RepID=UPI0008C1F35D|nr:MULTISPECIES: EAL domain-containing protein [unclassified Duganella]RZT10371.1 diguanylate cyclase (GGDEF)-like protein [Duganella sp. BK701]SEL16029.1 diguanylate cyclase (GGDEF) domain-containing protein [Duganella sp. CF402]
MFRHFLRRTGFQRQLTIMVSAGILSLAVFSALMNAWAANSRMRDHFIGQGQRIADNLARQSTLALLFHSVENARDVVGATLAFPDVAGLQIMDARRKVLLSRAQGGAKLDPAIFGAMPPSHAGMAGENADGWVFVAPVYGGQGEASPFELQDNQQQLLGYVHVQLSKATLNKLTWSLLLGNLGLTLSFAVILLVLARFLTRHMLTPLNALSRLMRRAESGESGMRATPDGPRDLIEMGQAFNQMMNVLEQREAAAVNMAQMKAQFAATVSHEVRTPLNGVVGMLDMLKETRLTQRQQEFVDVAWNSSRTLIALINNILDFSKMEAGKLTLEETEFSLTALLSEVTELLAGPAQQKGVTVSWVVDSDVPERVCADALRVRQILINLTGNAVKFTERGEVALRVSLAAADPLKLRFEVRDTGIGMSAEVQRHLFEAYSQPDPGTTRRFGGTGLGLAICKQLADLLGGEISVQSAAGSGTTFHFSIPCHPAQPVQPAQVVQSTVLHAPPRPMPERQYRVLIAEDNRTNQMVAAGMLAMNGCVCEFAADGVEAVRATQRDRFDLILMDCSMPEMDGYEATAHIRLLEQALGRRTPLIAMTANTQAGDAEKCLAAGMDDYLAKPITLVELRHKLEKWLPHAAPVAASPAANASAGNAAPAGGRASSGATSHAAGAPAFPPRSSTGGPAPVDLVVFDKLREVLGDSLPHAVTPYLEDMPACLDELAQAVRSGDMKAARIRAHTLKGASGNFGAEALAQLALQAEQLAAAGQPERIAPLLQPLNEQYRAVAAFLRVELSYTDADDLRPGDDLPQVLVVDDDRSTRSTLRHTLQRDGFRVEEASDGQQALSMLTRFQPDVILMDAMMPVMDGFTACARMQELPNGADIPVLMITALQDNSSVERAFAAGASDYIPKPIHYAVLSQRVRRIIEANRAEKRIRHLAYNDVLTSLPNRTLFFELLAKSIDHARSNEQQVAVLFMDLDRFKYVNDNLGHAVGDRLLQAVAQRVRQTVRSDDTVARLGGDEFTVVLNQLDNPAAAATAAHNIVRSLSVPFPIDGHEIFVTASVGIAMFPHDGSDVAALVKHADSAMYRAKRTNTGFQFYESSMEHSISEHVRLESDLRRAMEQQHQLEVHYQPQACVTSGRIIGMEALVRWRHPVRGMIAPAEFIPLAEETGIINQLGDWVLRTACAQLKQFIRNGLPEMRVAVNLSVRQLLQKDFAASVEAVLADTGLPPHLLELEITESTLMENAHDTLAALHRLRELGVRLSIDDFGTGYSSLSYLKRFPVDIIKIDRSFVQDLPQDPDDAAIVSAIIALAHSLRLHVVAEGVETDAQLDFLARRSCDMMQGYHLSPAIPADQFEDFARRAQKRINREIAS